ncbi:hypothetical protein CC78DRAFT_268172 [Lojkania enalia]|uniref:Uncharacterized protein n=1 Tax=Lojkania enalia TaxID=147567 RepID=A0A9P4K9F3_9PLEO|nr:hypothetical protein CC78DRAFT_268172 [Didymosphaeria enalia]
MFQSLEFLLHVNYTKDDENDLDDDFDDFGSPSLEDFVEYCGGHLPRLVHSELEQAFRLDLTNAVNTRSQQLNDLIGARDLKDLLDNSIQRGLQRCRSSFASYIQTQNTPDSVSDTPQSSPRATSQSQFPSHPSIRATPAPILSQTWDNVTLETDIRDFRLEETLDYWAWAPIEPLEASSEDNFRLPAFPANDPFVPNVGGLLEGPDISIQQPQATSYFHQDNIAPVSPPIQPQSFHQDQIMPSNQPIQPQTLPLNPVNSQAGLSIADHPHSGKAVGTRSAQIPIDKQGPVNYESSSSGAVDAFFDGPNIQRYFRS